MTTAQSSTPGPIPVDPWVFADVAYGTYHSPHSVLGGHLSDDGVTIRTVQHLADDVQIRTLDGLLPATHEQDGIWVTFIEGATEVPDYRVVVRYGETTTERDDPYHYLPTLGEVDQHLIGEGRHEQLWTVLGAHVRRYESPLGDVLGTSFAVWAPTARAVRVVGDFNYWNGQGHAMRSLGSVGVWEIFIPGVEAGTRYKFEIMRRDGGWHQKADPMARDSEQPPATASVVTETEYVWGDDQWLTQRAASDPHNGPISVYEVHLPSWRPDLKPRDMADQLIGHVSYLGFTHVEFMGVAQYPFSGSWGYQVTGYYAPTTRFGTPDDLRYIIDRLHQAGIGVIMDWVPAHFPKDDFALARFDGTALYEDPDPLRGEHPDWGTYIFNYGRREVRNFLVANALYWLQEFHIDALRVDAVASMLYLDYSREDGQWRPNQYGGRENLEAISFLQETTATAYRTCPGIMMIAEESTAWGGVTAPTEHGGLGFGLKWNMGWMNDTLRYMAEEPINRRWHHGELTFSLIYAFSEQFILPISHDEVVHGKGTLVNKMPGDRWQQLANVRALFTYMWSHPGKQLLFMGQEFAQDDEWDENKTLDWWLQESEWHRGVQSLVARLNSVYKEYPALWEQDHTYLGFEWINASDGDHNTISYVRKDIKNEDPVVAVINFAGVPHDYRVGVPSAGEWEEILNSDDLEFAGSGVTNPGVLVAEPIPWDGRDHSVALRLPPLGGVWLAKRQDAASGGTHAAAHEAPAGLVTSAVDPAHALVAAQQAKHGETVTPTGHAPRLADANRARAEKAEKKAQEKAQEKREKKS